MNFRDSLSERIEIDPRFSKKFESTEGLVMRIGIDLVAKFEGFPKQDPAQTDISPILTYQYSMNKDLYENGISVPLPLGITLVGPFEGEKYYPAFVTSYVCGREPLFVDPHKKRISELWEREIEKVLERGFIPEDHSRTRNCLYDEIGDKLFLIDFSNWKKKRTSS